MTSPVPLPLRTGSAWSCIYARTTHTLRNTRRTLNTVGPYLVVRYTLKSIPTDSTGRLFATFQWKPFEFANCKGHRTDGIVTTSVGGETRRFYPSLRVARNNLDSLHPYTARFTTLTRRFIAHHSYLTDRTSKWQTHAVHRLPGLSGSWSRSRGGSVGGRVSPARVRSTGLVLLITKINVTTDICPHVCSTLCTSVS